MITRYAIFIGKVRDGQDAGFRDYVENRLAPLWRQFDGASEVRVEYGRDQDPNGPEIPLMLDPNHWYSRADSLWLCQRLEALRGMLRRRHRCRGFHLPA